MSRKSVMRILDIITGIAGAALGLSCIAIGIMVACMGFGLPFASIKTPFEVLGITIGGASIIVGIAGLVDRIFFD